MHKQQWSASLMYWLRHNWAKLAAFCIWVAIIAAYWLYAQTYDLTAWEMMRRLSSLFRQTVIGPLLFITVFTLQPLVFFPSAVMGIVSGTLYGPVWGFIYTSIGAMGAASTTFWVGYFFGHDLPTTPSESRLERYRHFLHTNTFETLVILHLVFTPYDLVNYFSGYLRLRWWPFITAAFIGSIPGMMTFVLFGASLSLDEVNQTPQFNWTTLAFSAVMLVVSLAISQLLKRHEKQRSKTKQKNANLHKGDNHEYS